MTPPRSASKRVMGPAGASAATDGVDGAANQAGASHGRLAITLSPTKRRRALGGGGEASAGPSGLSREASEWSHGGLL